VRLGASFLCLPLTACCSCRRLWTSWWTAGTWRGCTRKAPCLARACESLCSDFCRAAAWRLTPPAAGQLRRGRRGDAPRRHRRHLMLVRMTQASTRCSLWRLRGEGAAPLDPRTGRAWAPHHRRCWASARRRRPGTGNGEAQRLRRPWQRPPFPWLDGEAGRRAPTPARRRPLRRAPSRGFTARLGVV